MAPTVDSIHRARTYKPFIDGLRAIAILTVVLSHIAFPGFSGGYIGVDIFFVISGYLIINQILEDIENKRFSIFGFWSRRAFRILPAFLLVMVISILLATTIFVQPEHKEISESFFLSAIMLANHHYLAHQGYFDLAAFTKPFLHMWSLAVEEQFYVVAPLILLGVTAATARMQLESYRRTWIGFTLALATVSFAACVAFTYPDGKPNISFYIMPTRGWEFILGGAVPQFATAFRRLPRLHAECLSIVGTALIVLAVLFLDRDTLYPFYWAALPAVGATLIIAIGLIEPRNIVARILATEPIVWIGLVSYAWYLWHWPLISFVRTMDLGEHERAHEISAALLSLALAALTYYLLERPVRHWRHSCTFRPVTVVAVGTSACVAVAIVGYLWSARIAPLMEPQLTGLEWPKADSADYPPVTHHGVLLGDSHAAVLRVPLAEAGHRAGSSLSVNARAGCPPLLNIVVKDDRGRIASYCEPFFHQIVFRGAEFAIIAARWNYYLGLPPSDPFYRSSVLLSEQATNDRENPYEVLAMGLAATISEAKREGVKRILIIGPLPEFPWYAPYCVMRAIRTNVDICAVPRAKVDERRARTITTLHQVSASFDDIRLIDPINIFCTATECRPNSGGELFFSDTSHLSPAGVEQFYRKYQRDFLWAMTGSSTTEP